MARVSLIALAAVAIGALVAGLDVKRMYPFGWIILGSTAIYGLLSGFLPERLLRRRISRREAMSFEQIYDASLRQLPYPRALVERMWGELAGDLGVDASKLRPADRFGVELSVKTFPLVDLSETVDARLRGRLRKAKVGPAEAGRAATIKTVCDYVEFICGVESRKQAA